MPGRVILDVTRGPLQGKTFVFSEHDTFLFGRATDAHARLSPDDTTASRHHFLLEVNPPDARVRDLGSRNGTFVNGVKHGGRAANETPEDGARRRHPEVDVKGGDEIKVGASVFKVNVEVPAVCVGCGTSIPDPFKSVCVWEAGTYICPPCREKANSGHKPAPPGGPHCGQCGRDVSAEVGERRGGDYVCHECRAKAEDDPAALLGRVLAEQSRLRGEPLPQGVAGYRLGKKLGAGGMGAVYLAERIADKKPVALKVMLAKVAVDQEARQGFLREIDVMKGLRHPHIVELFDHGSAGGAFYFAMELCPGGSLMDHLARRGRPLAVKEATPLMLETLEGLGYAHAQGYVHRDLKPANILLSAEGRGAKVADFGFAKNFEKAGLSGLTHTGTAAGTWPFMPREQLINFKYVKPVSDVWSIAATFYFVLTRALPRDSPRGRDPVDVVLENRIVPIRDREPGIAPRLAEVLDRALAAQTSDRFPTAGEFLKALAGAV
jgi:eukaryotic-like serine/threonine-protein kinase